MYGRVQPASRGCKQSKRWPAGREKKLFCSRSQVWSSKNYFHSVSFSKFQLVRFWPEWLCAQSNELETNEDINFEDVDSQTDSEALQRQQSLHRCTPTQSEGRQSPLLSFLSSFGGVYEMGGGCCFLRCRDQTSGLLCVSRDEHS